MNHVCGPEGNGWSSRTGHVDGFGLRRGTERPAAGRGRLRGGPPHPARPAGVGLALAILVTVLALGAGAPAHAQTENAIPADWSLKPDAVGAGETFRLMFVSTTTRNGSSTDIDDYNTHVQAAAAAGHAAIRPYSADFTAIGSTAAVNARDNTQTRSTHTDAPIYWVHTSRSRGAVADNYADFYDGTWGNTTVRDQSGSSTTLIASTPAITGTDLNGGTNGGLGSSSIRIWYLSSGTLVQGSTTSTNRRRMLGLSPIFRVAGGASVDATLSDLGLKDNDGAGITLTPAFASVTTSYTATVANAVDEITVVPTPNDTAATVEIQDEGGTALVDADTGTDGFQVALRWGDNTIKVAVTATDGTTIGLYTVIVSRALARPSVSPTGGSTTGLDVSWQAPGNTTIVSYDVQYREGDSGSFTDGPQDVTGTSTSTSIPGLMMNTSYQVQVRATSAAVVSEWSPNGRGWTHAPEATVASDWSLLPGGLATGAKFRLLFVSHDTRWNQSQIDSYNGWVQEYAATGRGHTAIRAHASGFRAVGCGRWVNARVNTGTQWSASDRGVPIHWLGGLTAADDYGDFYDGTWQNEDAPRTEAGALKPASFNGQVLTGCTNAGDTSAGEALGLEFSERGQLHANNAGPLDGGHQPFRGSRPIYGLSQVFVVGASSDVTAPRVASIERQDPSSSPTNADSLTWRVTFNENVGNVDAADFAVAGTTATLAVVEATASTVYDVIALGGDLAGLTATVTLSFASAQDIADTAGNALSNTAPTGANQASYAVDNTGPTVTITVPATSSAPFEATFAFSEAVDGFRLGDIVVGNGAASGFTGADGDMSYTAEIAPAADGAVTVDVAANVAMDAAGNGNTAAAQATSTRLAAAPTLVSATVPATGDEIVLIFDQDVSLLPSAAPEASTFTVTVDGDDTQIQGTLQAADSTPETPSGQDGWVIKVDTGFAFEPGATVVVVYTDPTADDDVRAVQNTSGVDAATFTTGIDAVPAVVNNSTNHQPTSSDSTATAIRDTDYTFAASDFPFIDADGDTLGIVRINTLPGAGEGTLKQNGTAIGPGNMDRDELDAGELTYSPPAGQTGTGVATFEFRVKDASVWSSAEYTMTMDVVAADSVAPRVASIERRTPSSSPTNADSLTWRVTFNENVGNVDAADFAVAGTTASLAVVEATASTVYDVTASGGDLAGLTATVTLSFASAQDIADTADNALSNTAPTGANQASYAVDNTRPTVTITVPGTSSAPFEATFAFSEAVDGFRLGDIVVGNGAASDFTGADGDMSYTAEIAPAADGAVTVDVAANVAMDAAGNGNTAAAQATSDYTGTNSAPTFDDGASTARDVAENTATGTDFGGPVAATDDDPLTYTLEGADAGSFGIDAGSGQLRTSAALDHETKSSYMLTVKADDGTGTDTIAVTVNVTDVAEMPAKPAAPTVTTTLNTTDSVDVSWTKPGRNGGPDIVGYKLRRRVGVGSWIETTPSGTGTMASIAGLAEDTEYEVQVQALNGETPSDWSEHGTGSTGAGSNSAPTFDDGASTARDVAENTASGQDVGTPVSADDPDNDPLTYTLEGTDAGSFGIDRTTGQLRTSAALDHESKASYTLTVKADDEHGGTDTIVVTVNVTDVDEPPSAPGAPPTVSAVQGSGTSLSVRWSAPANTGPRVTDYDLRYKATGGRWTDGPENVTGRSATIGGLAADTEYEVQVLARNDEGESGWSTSGRGTTGEVLLACNMSMETVTVHEGETARFTIVISPPLPRDDILLWHVHTYGEATFPEDMPSTGGLADLKAGATEVVGEVLTYTDDETEPTEGFQISMDYASWRARPDWRSTPSCVGRIYIRDGASNGVPAFADGASTTRDVDENTASGQPVWTAVTADDPNDDPVTYALEGRDAGSFRIDPGTGQLRTRAALDHEAKAAYEVTVRADDDHGGTATIAVTVNVEDVDEKSATPAAPAVTATANATDSLDVGWQKPDLNGGPDVVGYRLRSGVRGGSTWFETTTLYPATARSATIDGLAEDTEYDVRVRALNGETTSDWSSAGFGRTGANAPPVFDDGARTTRSVAENTASGQPVGLAVSADDPNDDELTYTLEGPDADSFGIDSRTGQLRTSAALDHESKASHTLTVKADDGEGGTATIAVAVNATDVDEPPRAPDAPTVAGGETNLSVRWSAPENTGPPVTDYDLRYRETGGSWTYRPSNVTGRSATINGLATDTAYDVQVLARNDEGESGWSASGRGSTDGGHSVYMAAVTVYEGETAGFTIEFEPAPKEGEDLRLSWYTRTVGAREGEDFHRASGQHSLEVGQTEVTGEVATIEDDDDEGDEQFQIGISFGGYGTDGETIEEVDAAGNIFIRDGQRPVSASPSARVVGDLLTLRYPDPLDAGSTPGPKDWVVRAATATGSRTLAVTGVSVLGAEVALVLSPPAAAGESVAVSYLPWAMHPLLGPEGAEAAPLTELPVRNETPASAPVEPPPLAPLDVEAGLAEEPAIGTPAPFGPWLSALLAERPAASVTRLDLSDRGLTDVSAQAALTGLEVLDLRGNALADVWPLAGLSNLRRLDLSGNRIEDVSALAGLAELEVLLLDGNRVRDVLPLSLLPRLARLDLSGNRVTDAALLAELRSLARLDLSGNRVADASPLGDLSRLVWLDLSGNPVSDTGPLGRLTALRWLWLDADAPGLGALIRGQSPRTGTDDASGGGDGR